ASAFSPVVASLFIHWILRGLPACRDSEDTLLAESILLLIPLQFIVPYESFLERPYVGIGPSFILKFVTPHQAVTIIFRGTVPVGSQIIKNSERPVFHPSEYGVSVFEQHRQPDITAVAQASWFPPVGHKDKSILFAGDRQDEGTL